MRSNLHKDLYLKTEQLLKTQSKKPPKGIYPFRGPGRGRSYIAQIEYDLGVFIFIKTYMRGGLISKVNKTIYFGKRRFYKEFRIAKLLNNKGVPTLKPLAVVTRRVFGPFYRGAFLTYYESGYQPLAFTFQRYFHERLIKMASNLVLKIHDLGIEHKDLNLNNILVRKISQNFSLLIIDFDRASIQKKPLSSLKRSLALFRIYRSATRILGKEKAIKFIKVFFMEYRNNLPLKLQNQQAIIIKLLKPLKNIQYFCADLFRV